MKTDKERVHKPEYAIFWVTPDHEVTRLSQWYKSLRTPKGNIPWGYVDEAVRKDLKVTGDQFYIFVKEPCPACGRGPDELEQVYRYVPEISTWGKIVAPKRMKLIEIRGKPRGIPIARDAGQTYGVLFKPIADVAQW